MNGALRHPALQGVAGVAAFVALTWPLLVFDRPVHVVVSFFLIWLAVIGLLFIFSRAPDGPEPDESDDDPSSDGTSGHTSTGGPR
jgi:hypothetical protein